MLVSTAFAGCAGYHEIFEVQVLDAKLRTLSDAEVTVTYDRGTSFGEQYFTTPIHYTDANGKTSFDILNQGTTTRKIDCDIVITASVAGNTKEETIIAEQHGSVVSVIFDNVYPVNFYVRDHFNGPLSNATVTIGTGQKKTNENGVAKYYLKTGTYEYFASYLEANEAGNLTVEDDIEFQVTFPYYKVEIEVVNDYGEPLNATLTIYNETMQIDGHFENNRTFGQEIRYEARYAGLIESGSIIPEVKPNALIVFDVHAPLFGQIDSQITTDRAKLTIPVSDQGQYASGVDLSSIVVSYRMEPADPSTPWSNAVVFPVGYSTFTAEISGLPENSIVSFSIDLKDKAGNRATIDGQFSTLSIVNQTNNTQNQTDTHDSDEDAQKIPLFYIFGGIIVVILVIYLGNRIKSQATGGV